MAFVIAKYLRVGEHDERELSAPRTLVLRLLLFILRADDDNLAVATPTREPRETTAPRAAEPPRGVVAARAGDRENGKPRGRLEHDTGWERHLENKTRSLPHATFRRLCAARGRRWCRVLAVFGTFKAFCDPPDRRDALLSSGRGGCSPEALNYTSCTRAALGLH